MTVRIDWNTSALHAGGDDDDDDGEGGGAVANSGTLVWSGVTGKRAFSTFRFEDCPTAPVARKFLSTHGLAHYWDMVISGRVEGEGAGGLSLAAVDDQLAVVGLEKLLSAPQQQSTAGDVADADME